MFETFLEIMSICSKNFQIDVHESMLQDVLQDFDLLGVKLNPFHKNNIARPGDENPAKRQRP